MSAETPSKSITLYFREGSSDKVYQAGIEPKGTGFVVNFAFGRRGSTLQTGTKTAEPVDYQTAVKVYDKLVKEKMAKGYTPGEEGTPYQGTGREAAATGIFPQLLNAVDQNQAQQLVRDDDWWMQEKFDGKRILIRKDGDKITGINRKGLVVALPQPITQQALACGGRASISGSWMARLSEMPTSLSTCWRWATWTCERSRTASDLTLLPVSLPPKAKGQSAPGLLRPRQPRSGRCWTPCVGSMQRASCSSVIRRPTHQVGPPAAVTSSS